MKHSILTWLKSRLESITPANGFTFSVGTVRLRRLGVDYAAPSDLPSIEIVEDGNEQLEAEDETHLRWVAGLNLWVITEGADDRPSANEVIEAIKKSLNTATSFDPAILEIHIDALEIVNTGDNVTTTLVSCIVRYVQLMRASAGDTDQYSTPTVLKTISEKVSAQLVLLQAAQAGTDTPLTNIYEGHATADLRLVAATYEVVTGEFEAEPQDTTGEINISFVTVSVRVHTAYEDRGLRPARNRRLIDSIHTWFNRHRSLGDDWRYWNTDSVAINQEFQESATSGGEILLRFYSPVLFTQV